MNNSIKRLFSAASFLVAFAVPTFAAEAKVGFTAPEFTLTDIAGNSHSLSDFAGKTVVMEWVNPECPFVVKHYDSGNLPSLQTAATGDDVIWLVINSASPGAQGDYPADKVKAWQEKTGAAPTAYLRDPDGTVGRLYGAKVTPHMYVINPEGKLVYNGAIDSIASADIKDIAKAENYVTAALNAVRDGTMPERTTTRPYGCGVKY